MSEYRESWQRARILDCTLRDGGYYTAWDFDEEAVDVYLDAMSRLDIDTIELGYCNPPRPGYFGQYYFLTEATTRNAKQKLAPSQRAPSMMCR